MSVIKKALIPFLAALIFTSLLICTPIQTDALSPYTPFPIAWQQRENAGAETQRLSYIPEMENWCFYPWNRGSETNNTVGLAGCSLFSIINNVYYNTGEFVSPIMLADYTLENGYRVVGVDGVRVEFFEDFAVNFGAEYGMSYSGYTTSAEEVLQHIRNGGTSSSNIYGHWITIVDYDEETDLYLILDSCQSSSRCNNITWTDRENGVAWLTAGELLANGKSGYYGINQRYSALFTFDYTFTAETGDADGNGTIDIRDATAMLEYYARTSAGIECNAFHPHPQKNEVCTAAADVDGDGSITTSDAMIVLEIYAENAAYSEEDTALAE